MLDPRLRAGQKYEDIAASIKILPASCLEPEDLADEPLIE